MTSNFKVYIGNVGSPKQIDVLKLRGWGTMISATLWRNSFRQLPYWALDNGAFTYWKRGEPFNEEVFFKCLNKIPEDQPPDFVVIPDLVGKGVESLRFSLDWYRDTLQDEYGHLRWYLAVQDGMMPADLLEEGIDYDGIFVGGTPDWKVSWAPVWVKFAHRGLPYHSLPCHIGRVGTAERLTWAAAIGADSVDSTTFVQTKYWMSRFGMLRGAQETEPTRYICEHCQMGMHGCTDPLCRCVCHHRITARPAPEPMEFVVPTIQKGLEEFPGRPYGTLGKRGFLVQWVEDQDRIMLTMPRVDRIRDGRLHPMLFQDELWFTYLGQTESDIEIWKAVGYIEPLHDEELIAFIATSDISRDQRHLVGYIYTDQSWVLGDGFPTTHRGGGLQSPVEFMGPRIEEWLERIGRLE